jgi:hypothetical protein
MRIVSSTCWWRRSRPGSPACRGPCAPSAPRDRGLLGHAGHDHVRVADGLDLLEAVAVGQGVEAREQLVEHRDQGLGRGPGRQRSEPDDVGEQDGHRLEAIDDHAFALLEPGGDRRRQHVEQQALRRHLLGLELAGAIADQGLEVLAVGLDGLGHGVEAGAELTDLIFARDLGPHREVLVGEALDRLDSAITERVSIVPMMIDTTSASAITASDTLIASEPAWPRAARMSVSVMSTPSTPGHRPSASRGPGSGT